LKKNHYYPKVKMTTELATTKTTPVATKTTPAATLDVICENEILDILYSNRECYSKAGAIMYILNALETQYYTFLLPHENKGLIDQSKQITPIIDTYKLLRAEFQNSIAHDMCMPRTPESLSKIIVCSVRLKIHLENMKFAFYKVLDEYFDNQVKINDNSREKAFKYLTDTLPEQLLQSLFDDDVKLP